MKGYKGFDKDLKCRNFQYKVGEIFEEKVTPEVCSRGLHYCEYPLDVLAYYPPVDGNRFCEVEALGDIAKDEDSNDTKVATNKLKISAEISLKNLIDASVKFVYDHVKKDKKKSAHKEEPNTVATNTGYSSVATNTGYSSVATNTGNRSVATNTGYSSVATNTGYSSVATNTGYSSVATNTGYSSVATNTGNRSVATNTGYSSVATNTGYSSVATNTGYSSVATNTGNRSVATNTGDSSVATNTGNRSVATNTGDSSVASNTGKNGIAASFGKEGQAKGAVGSWLVLTEWIDKSKPDDWLCDWEIKEIKAVKVDGEIIKPDTLYTLKDGKIVEVSKC